MRRPETGYSGIIIRISHSISSYHDGWRSGSPTNWEYPVSLYPHRCKRETAGRISGPQSKHTESLIIYMSEEYLDPKRLSLIPTRSNSTQTATDMDQESAANDEAVPVPAVLQSLEDDKCRAILTALPEPKSATDLCTECDLASSTVYRKLERLRDAGLVK